MDDDLSVLLSGFLHGLATKEQRHGHINARISPLEMLRLGLETLHHVNVQVNAHTGTHPATAMCEPLLSANMPDAMAEISELARDATETQFQRFIDNFADYGAAQGDPLRRKRAGLMLYALGAARSAAQLGNQGNPQAFMQQAPYQPQGRPAPQYRELEPPPHPAEPMFVAYMRLGPGDGADRIKIVFDTFDKASALKFFKQFKDYAASLRDTQNIKTAMALSNAMYGIYDRKFTNERIALPAPERRN